jgi:hypothetical protein
MQLDTDALSNLAIMLSIPFLWLSQEYTVVLTLNPVAPENGIIFSLPQAVPAGQIKSFAIPQQKETIN